MMNAPMPYELPRDQRTFMTMPMRGARTACAFPSPRPSALGRGRTSRRLEKAVVRSGVSPCVAGCSLSLRERARVRENRSLFASSRRPTSGIVEFHQSAGEAEAFPDQ